jgi:hypothetical protein
MTRRLCLIGNSHLAAFKMGWEAVRADHPEADVTFFVEAKGRSGPGSRRGRRPGAR